MLIVFITCVCERMCVYVCNSVFETIECFFTYHSSLELLRHISVTLEADRQAGEVVLSGCITLRSSRCTHMHTETHNPWGKTGIGPPSERPSQNQLAFKLMKRVMKRALSLLHNADRQPETIVKKAASKTFKWPLCLFFFKGKHGKLKMELL